MMRRRYEELMDAKAFNEWVAKRRLKQEGEKYADAMGRVMEAVNRRILLGGREAAAGAAHRRPNGEKHQYTRREMVPNAAPWTEAGRPGRSGSANAGAAAGQRQVNRLALFNVASHVLRSKFKSSTSLKLGLCRKPSTRCSPSLCTRP